MSPQTFDRSHIKTHCVGDLWPEFLGSVSLGESFIVETERFNEVNGPIEIEGIKRDDLIAVHIEKIEILPPYEAPNGGPFYDGQLVPLTFDGEHFYFPDKFKLKAEPSIGNVAVLPFPSEEILSLSKEFIHEGQRWRNERGWRRVVSDPRGKHCHQDCPWLGEGSVIHMKAQVDGAGLCLGDVHGYLGEGEMAFAGIEVNAILQLRVERSVGWYVDWPLIETEEEVMVCSSYTSTYTDMPHQRYVDVVKQAYRSLLRVVSEKAGCSIEDANPLVASAISLRNCAIYGLGEGYIPQHVDHAPFDIAVVASIPKHVFVNA